MSFKLLIFWSCTSTVTLLASTQVASSGSPYDSAIHYWPLDKLTGLLDIFTNTSGIRDGRVKEIHFKGNGPGYLFIAKSRVNLGNFKGSCLVNPVKCSTYLTVSLWLRYSRKKDIYREQFFIGTRRYRKRRGQPGFSIQAVPQKGAENRISIEVNTDKKLWVGYTDIAHGTWAQVGFTWSNSSGLAIFKNCKRVQSVVSGTEQFSSKMSNENLYLVKAPGKGKAAFNISFDDIAVWYSPLNQMQKERICSAKLEAPVLTCLSGTTWISVTWKPSDPDFDMLTGFYVFYKYTLDKRWKRVEANSTQRMHKIIGLEPSLSVDIRIQNKIHDGHGRMSTEIICRTSDVLGSPNNLTVEATSSRAILLTWKRPTNRTGVQGYWVLYKEERSSDFKKLDVGLPYKRKYLISNLTKNTRYEIKVISYSRNSSYKPSLPAKLTAATDENDSRTVLKVNILPVRETTVLVSWEPPADPFTRFWYKVYMQWKRDSQQKMIEIYRGNSTKYAFSMRNMPSPHEFYVMAYMAGFLQPAHIMVPPQNVTIQSVTWGLAVVTWQPPLPRSPRDLVNRYHVIVESRGKRVELMTTHTSVNVTGLKQLTSYRLNVQAGNQVGYGPLLTDDVVFITPDMNECAELKNSCTNTSGTLVFNESQCALDVVRCDKNAHCVNTEGSFYCKCRSNFIGDGWTCGDIPGDVTEMDFCQEEISQKIKWSRTLRGQTDVSSCPEGVTGVSRRLCGGSEGQRALWETPDLSDCVSKWALEMENLANDPKVSASSVAGQTASLTDVKRANKIYPGDLKAMVNVLGVVSNREEKKTQPVSSNETTEFTKSVVNTASNILDSKIIGKWAFIPKVSRKTQTGALIGTLDSVALQMAKSGNHGRTTMKNVVLDVGCTNQSTSSYLVIGEKKTKQEENQTVILFPSSELDQGSSSQYFTYASFNTMGPLLAPEANRINGSVNTAVVSLKMSNIKRKTFEDPVTLVFSNKNRSKKKSNSSCVFWNMKRVPGFWSSNGCHVNLTNTTHTVCHCYHLTSFAVLMSVKGDTSALIKGRHKIALTLITYIGVVISVTALCITFFTFLTFRFLKSSRTFIHSNLALSLILAQLLFLFGINKTQIKLVCQIIAGALHYIWLTSFAWMALEGVMLYLMLVKVFNTKNLSRKKRFIFLTIGWCFPLMAVAVSAGLYPNGYGTQYYCWLSMDQGFIWAFVGPALLVIAFNFVIMGVVFSVMSRRTGHRRKDSKIRRIRYWAKACTLLTCILGLTWLFGVFYINNETIFMAYFFTIFNSLQGVFIFLFHCVGDEKIRREYIRILCCREKGPAYTMASKSQKSDSSGEKMIKTLDNGESKVINYNTVSTGTTSSDSQRPVLVMFQKRPSIGQHFSYNQGDSDSSGSSQRNSVDVINNPRDSLASFSSFKLQNRNSGRYSAVSREADVHDHKTEPNMVLQLLGELSVVEEVSSTVQDASAVEEASHA